MLDLNDACGREIEEFLKNAANPRLRDEVLADWDAAMTRKAVWKEPDARGACLDGLPLASINAHGIDLSGAHLVETDFTEADMSFATLRAAEARGIRLRGAKLNPSHLDFCNATDSDLWGVDLDSATTHQFNLNGAKGAMTHYQSALTVIAAHDAPRILLGNDSSMNCELWNIFNWQNQNDTAFHTHALGMLAALYEEALSVEGLNVKKLGVIKAVQLAEANATGDYFHAALDAAIDGDTLPAAQRALVEKHFTKLAPIERKAMPRR